MSAVGEGGGFGCKVEGVKSDGLRDKVLRKMKREGVHVSFYNPHHRLCLTNPSNVRVLLSVHQLPAVHAVRLRRGQPDLDRISALSIILNNEARRRQSTRAIILGKAKVMSYKELIARRAE